MKIQFRSDSIHIEGYVNCVNRPSKKLHEGGEEFVEIIEAGTFKRALELNPVDLLVNHNNDNKVGDTLTNVKLEEDEIGLKIEANITDIKVIDAFKAGNIRQMSFGFICKDSYDKVIEGIRNRFVRSIELFEVSLLDKLAPAYTGSLIQMRSESGVALEVGELIIRSIDIDLSDETKEEIVIEEESNIVESEDQQEVLKLWLEFIKLEKIKSEVWGWKVSK